MNPMMKLLARNRHKGTFSAEQSEDGERATLYLYDAIVDSDDEAEFWGGVSPQAFVKTLNSIQAPEIHLRVNSPGGSVFAARAMEQALREHDARIVSHVDGLAASAASFLVVGASDEIVMAHGAFNMIHKAWTIAWGNADNLLHVAGLLEQLDDTLVATYAERTGQSAADIAQWMRDETWFDAERAVELGFADRVAESKPRSKASALARAWDLSAFEHAPEIEREEPPTEEPADPREAMARQVAVIQATRPSLATIPA